jgi:hypothetical protein
MGALQKKRKRVQAPMFSSNFNKKRLIINLVFRFWGHDGAYESKLLFGAKEEDDDDNNISMNMQQNNEGEKAKGGWVLCKFFWVLFCGVSFFFYPFLSTP